MLDIDIIYIINVREDRDRLVETIENLTQAGYYNYKIIEAINGDNLDTDQLLSEGTLNNTFSDPNGNLNPNIIACALSHRKAYLEFNKSSYNRCLIIEDDIQFTPEYFIDYTKDVIKVFNQNMNKYQDKWEIIQLGKMWDKLTSTRGDVKYLNEVTKFLPDYAAHAYILNKKSVKKLIESTNKIKHAADTNLDVTFKTIHCPPRAWVVQNQGEFSDELFTNLTSTIRIWNQSRILPSRLRPEDYPKRGVKMDNFMDVLKKKDSSNPPIFKNNLLNCKIFKVKIKGVKFGPVKTPNNEVLDNWAIIELD